ncbi:MAG: fumarylacetoacetate hydrolase family protein [Hyphomicrobiaceae bacterium]|nr:MAG: fumarylacetoacetate hydrolase family protein [Hyphomicrobiaceae bacterium]
MRLASYRVNGGDRYGAVVGNGIVDLGSRLPKYATLRDLIAADALAEAKAAVRNATVDHALDAVTFLPPVVAPEKIWCIGVNYADRNEEYKDNSAAPKYPSLFCRAPASLVGHGQPIERPRVSTQLDYEGEIVIVVGKGGRRIPREQALAGIFGLTLCNEGSVRDWLRHGKFNVTQGKNFDKSGSIGPWIVTSDEVDLKAPLELTTRVNGEVRQNDSTARLMFPFDYLISYLSTFATLKPGDVIVTGTPTGAGVRFDPPRWLVPGDVVEVEVPQIGVLRNTVVDETAG